MSSLFNITNRSFKPTDGIFVNIRSKQQCNIVLWPKDKEYASKELTYNELRSLRNCINQALIRMQFKEK